MSNNVNLLTDLVIGAISIIIKRLKCVGQSDKQYSPMAGMMMNIRKYALTKGAVKSAIRRQ